ncbi:hypothetical protein C5O27_09120 [Gordonia alkanivorans]|uniref:hypothetical protein n=1 Tax=Gordonia alkanivorans TaxID=84096 RepID=UPI000FDF637C|nr:hypothetical protein [Gordonia alkanivorans]AZZ83650.1 hypothetical protein C5O27_09120 [Gordonia alkanivorans]
MIGTCEHDRDVERGAVDSAFGIGSRPLWVTMAMFSCGYLAVTLYANADVTGVWQWVGIIAGFLFFAFGGFLILDAPGDPLPMPTTVVIAVLAVAGVTTSLFSLPFPLTHVMQTGPSIGASVIALAFVAVRGRPLAAWIASIVISVIATGWGHVATQGAMWGLAVTLPGYAIMIMGSLFSLMLRPMARQLYALREANEQQAALDAAAAAAAEVRDRRLAALDERARPILTRIAERIEFSVEEVAVARLIEAQLRDGIRASDLDVPEVRDAAWRARQRGVKVVLLDDGGLSVLADDEAARARDRLGAAVVELLADAESGRVTVRIHPPGRKTLASLGVDTDDQVELVEFTSAGAALQTASADRRLAR